MARSVRNDSFLKDRPRYDASYLDLAMKKGLPLATLDEKLRKAAVQTSVLILAE